MTAVLGGAWPFVGRDAELEVISEWLAERHTVVITGRAGVGKTRLLDTILDQAATQGARVARATGSRAAQEIPLGAVAHLLDREELEPRPGPGGMARVLATGLDRLDVEVLAVDDAHLLDGPTAVLLRALIDARRCRVLLGVRTGEPLPDPLERAVRAPDSTLVVEVQELSEPAIGELLADALGAPVDRALPRQLWSVTRGNPLYVRELVRALLEREAISRAPGGWRWDGRVPASAGLRGLLDERADRLDAAGREALDLVAVGEPLALDLVEAVVGSERIEHLEREELVTVRGTPEQAVVLTSHPLIGEAARAQLPVTRGRAIRRRLADGLDARGIGSVDDALRSAVWRLDSGGRPNPALAAAAARRAWAAGDPVLAERLARVAVEDADDGEARYLLAEALADQGRHDEALAEWASLSGHADLALRIAALRGRCQAIGFALGRPDDALALLEAAVADDPTMECAEVHALRTSMLTFSAGPALGAQAATEAAAAHDSEEAELSGFLSSAVIEVLAGSTGSVSARLPRARALAERLADARPDGPLWVGIVEFFVDYCEGRLAVAERTARDRLDAALGSPSLARSFWTYALGLAVLHRGAASEASLLLAESVELQRADVRTMSRGPLDALAVALAATGDTVGARRALAEAEDLAPRIVDPIAPLRAEAWVLATEGALGEAAEAARRCAAEERASGRRFFELVALHDAGRLGAARLVVDRAGELASEIDGALADTMAAHLRAVVSGDRHGVAEAAATFESLGADLLAAEAWSAAAASAGRAGSAAEAHRFAERADRARAACGPVATPGLLVQPWADPLSPREREVALLAAGGATDREIAARLVVSPRTIHAHLRSIYQKLGVAGRAELPRALGR